MNSKFAVKRKMFSFLFLLGGALAALPAVAEDTAPGVTIDSVNQRWPWNNKVDIEYTVKGGQTRSLGVYAALRFTLTAGGKTYSFEGHEIGASAENGTNVATWEAPPGIKASDCSITATLFSTNVPSGSDYMIIDLTTGAVHYEGLYATQDLSNQRYNTDEYKTTKMVLRKVPATAKSSMLPNGPFADGYPTGDGNYKANMPTRWITDRDYYIGVFMVTQKQYKDLYGSNPSGYTKNYENNIKDHRPVERVSWDELRVATTEPGDKIPTVSTSNTGTFLQRLNFITGNKFEIDLPTFVMSEIATRAGATSQYFWGDEPNQAYVVHDANTTVAVGSCLPNDWGIFDPSGNAYEWVRDNNLGNIHELPDAFTPCPTVIEVNNNGKEVVRRRRRGGGTNDTVYDNAAHRASYSYWYETYQSGYSKLGFRVAIICD